jgi:sialic acid synthase SpsE/mannose-6-phosphate isomerase-like protein (cupin superfamily)
MDIPSDKPFIVFEMANNHNGRLEHGLRIIREIHDVARGFGFHFAFKFQYRHLETFIHPDYRGRSDVKYVHRFTQTRLGPGEFRAMKAELDRLDLLSVCTPFDERSVDLIEEHGIAIIKLASCSLTDWPLLERVVLTDKPIIASTAGATLDDIDRVVSFLEHRQKRFALMHCIAEYPTPRQHFELNQLRLLQSRYSGVRVGWSTHESPGCTDSVKMAMAAGATIFEKHVGVPTDGWPLNDYSATPEQVRTWLSAAHEAVEMCGVSGQRHHSPLGELDSLRALRRGVFAKRAIHAGERINPESTFLAIPSQPDQLTANDLSKYSEFRASKEVPAGAPLLWVDVTCTETRERVYAIVQRVKALLAEGHVVVPGKADLEISHHYGLDRFDEYGATMITVVNRGYCKKLIIVLPGQSHPEQHHKLKEETFHVLWGGVTMTLDGELAEFHQGDVVVIEPGRRHAFTSRNGAVIEEISSTHFGDDSYYTDPVVSANRDRKTLLTHWME